MNKEAFCRLQTSIFESLVIPLLLAISGSCSTVPEITPGSSNIMQTKNVEDLQIAYVHI